MSEFFIHGGLFSDFVVRCSALLLLGITASYVWQRRPDRAHQLLCAAMLAAIIAPAVCLLVRQQNWGMLPPRLNAESVASATITQLPLALSESSETTGSIATMPADATAFGPIEPASMLAATADTPAAHVATDTQKPAASINWQRWLLYCWLCVSALLLLRIVARYVSCRRLIATSRPATANWIESAVREAIARLNLADVPSIRHCRRAQSPMIWCWGGRPTLLLPADVKQSDNVDWVAVFSHELAHWKRRDHLTALAADVLVAILPWNPVLFWCRNRLETLSEMSCDDWAVTRGASAVDYADSLLNLIPESQPTMALSVVSRGNLSTRVRRLLSGNFYHPGVGRRWRALVATALLSSVGLIALAQAKAAMPQRDGVDEQARPANTSSAGSQEVERSPLRVVRGSVVSPTGEPIAGVPVYWLGRPTALAANAAPRGRSNKPALFAEGKTDSAGRFELGGAGPPPNLSVEQGANFIVADAKGFGLGGKMVTNYDDEVRVKLPKNLPIEGRLLTPDGEPAVGVIVEVSLMAHLESMLPPRGWGAPSEVLRGGGTQALPVYSPATTDKDGRFTLNGFSKGSMASLKVTSKEFAPEEIHVHAPSGLMSLMQRVAGSMKALKPKFTHTLEPGRIVTGTVVADDTNQPIANCLVEVGVSRNGPSAGSQRVRTDKTGKFSVTCGAGLTYSIRALPPSEGGYLPHYIQKNSQEWTDGTKPLVTDFLLRKGKLVKGKVIDASTGEPIAGAGIEYQAHGKNPDRVGANQHPRVLSGKDGSFQLTCLGGKGFLVAEAPSQAFARQRIKSEEHSRGEDWYVHGITPLELKNDESQPVTIRLNRGVSIKAKVVDPNGVPLENVAVYFNGMGAQLTHRFSRGQTFPTDQITLRECDPETTYRVFFVHERKQLGAVAELKFDPDKVPVVTLQPAGKIRGRMLTKDGTPMANAQVMAMVKTASDFQPRTMRFNDRDRSLPLLELAGEMSTSMKGIPRTDEQGRFEIEDVVPGAEIYVHSFSRREIANSKLARVAPGESLDLGDIHAERF